MLVRQDEEDAHPRKALAPAARGGCRPLCFRLGLAGRCLLQRDHGEEGRPRRRGSRRERRRVVVPQAPYGPAQLGPPIFVPQPDLDQQNRGLFVVVVVVAAAAASSALRRFHDEVDAEPPARPGPRRRALDRELARNLVPEPLREPRRPRLPPVLLLPAGPVRVGLAEDAAGVGRLVAAVAARFRIDEARKERLDSPASRHGGACSPRLPLIALLLLLPSPPLRLRIRAAAPEGEEVRGQGQAQGVDQHGQFVAVVQEPRDEAPGPVFLVVRALFAVVFFFFRDAAAACAPLLFLVVLVRPAAGARAAALLLLLLCHYFCGRSDRRRRQRRAGPPDGGARTRARAKERKEGWALFRCPAPPPLRVFLVFSCSVRCPARVVPLSRRGKEEAGRGREGGREGGRDGAEPLAGRRLGGTDPKRRDGRAAAGFCRAAVLARVVVMAAREARKIHATGRPALPPKCISGVGIHSACLSVFLPLASSEANACDSDSDCLKPPRLVQCKVIVTRL
jgi:hypothetical protein